MTDRDADVAEFHRAFGYPVRTTPQVPPDDEVRLRARLKAEEFFEEMRATLADSERMKLDALESILMDAINTAPVDVDIVELADSQADQDYISAGTRLAYGIPGDAVWSAVHTSNMEKKGGVSDEHGKLQKPEGWKPPDIEGVLRYAGWNP